MTTTIIVVATVMLLMVVTIAHVITFTIFTEANSMQGAHYVYQLLSPIGNKIATTTTYSRLRQLLITQTVYLKQVAQVLIYIGKSLRY